MRLASLGAAPVVNALFTQRCAVINVMRACLGLAPDNHMTLEHRFASSLESAAAASASNGNGNGEPITKKARMN
tara:strand:+ start:151 stop:372 length:222 start_codon:yes stop_codon:yes gene_type:complete